MAQPGEPKGQVQAETRGESERGDRDYWFRFTVEVPRRTMAPREFGDHVRGAQRELLLAARSLVDAAIERIDQADRARSRRATRIQVE